MYKLSPSEANETLSGFGRWKRASKPPAAEPTCGWRGGRVMERAHGLQNPGVQFWEGLATGAQKSSVKSLSTSSERLAAPERPPRRAGQQGGPARGRRGRAREGWFHPGDTAAGQREPPGPRPVPP